MDDNLLDYSNPKDKKFNAWMKQLDKYVMSTVGVGVFDLEDYSWRACFEAGDSPKEAFDEARLEGAFTGMEDFDNDEEDDDETDY